MTHRYRITIPRPRSKRVDREKELRVLYHNGWWSTGAEQVQVPAGVYEVEIEVAEVYEPAQLATVFDGPTFQVDVEYCSASGRRHEHYRPVPERIHEARLPTLLLERVPRAPRIFRIPEKLHVPYIPRSQTLPDIREIMSANPIKAVG